MVSWCRRHVFTVYGWDGAMGRYGRRISITGIIRLPSILALICRGSVIRGIISLIISALNYDSYLLCGFGHATGHQISGSTRPVIYICRGAGGPVIIMASIISAAGRSIADAVSGAAVICRNASIYGGASRQAAGRVVGTREGGRGTAIFYRGTRCITGYTAISARAATES